MLYLYLRYLLDLSISMSISTSILIAICISICVDTHIDVAIDTDSCRCINIDRYLYQYRDGDRDIGR